MHRLTRLWGKIVDEIRDRYRSGDRYRLEDFGRVEKIDAHVHVHMVDSPIVRQAREDRFRLITINTDCREFPPLDVQENVATELSGSSPRVTAYLCTFDAAPLFAGDSSEGTIQTLRTSRSRGAAGVKIWKNVGMDIRRADGSPVSISDSVLDPVFEHLVDDGVSVLGHQGEPRNCWLALEEMSVAADRHYYAEHPEFHMHLQPDEPSYEEQLAARDSVLERHPGLTYVGAHLASMEWSVAELGRWLDRFPTTRVDLAARIPHLAAQAISDRSAVRDFFLRYRDRILYGTDHIDNPESAPDDVARQARRRWLRDWRYLATEYRTQFWELDAEVRGLGLPRDVIDRVYRQNALEAYPDAFD